MTDALDTTMMKWSAAGWPNWCDFAISLQAELDDERARAQQLTTERDRAMDEAANARDHYRAVAITMGVELLAYMAAVHFFDGLHAYALRGRIANQRAELHRLNVQAKRNADALAEHARLRDLAREGRIGAMARQDATNDLIDAISMPAGRDFDQAWEAACFLHGRSDYKPTLLRPLPAATATLDGWKVGDACEVRLISEGRWSLGSVAGRLRNGRLGVVVDGDLLDVHESRLRRPIPPSEPTTEGGRGLDTVTDADIASTFGACPDLPEPCTECQEAPCHICGGVPSKPFCSRCPSPCPMTDGVRDCKRERDEAIARAERAERDCDEALREATRATQLGESLKLALRMPHAGNYVEWAKEVRDAYDRATRAERTLQRVRDVLTNADRLYGTAHGAHVRVLAILKEESGR